MIINVFEKLNPLLIAHAIEISAFFTGICNIIMQVDKFALPFVVEGIIIQAIAHKCTGKVIYRSERGFAAVNLLFDFSFVPS